MQDKVPSNTLLKKPAVASSLLGLGFFFFSPLLVAASLCWPRMLCPASIHEFSDLG